MQLPADAISPEAMARAQAVYNSYVESPTRMRREGDPLYERARAITPATFQSELGEGLKFVAGGLGEGIASRRTGVAADPYASARMLLASTLNTYVGGVQDPAKRKVAQGYDESLTLLLRYMQEDRSGAFPEFDQLMRENGAGEGLYSFLGQFQAMVRDAAKASEWAVGLDGKPHKNRAEMQRAMLGIDEKIIRRLGAAASSAGSVKSLEAEREGASVFLQEALGDFGPAQVERWAATMGRDDQEVYDMLMEAASRGRKGREATKELERMRFEGAEIDLEEGLREVELMEQQLQARNAAAATP
jgi:hypothetical protein